MHHGERVSHLTTPVEQEFWERSGLERDVHGIKWESSEAVDFLSACVSKFCFAAHILLVAGCVSQNRSYCTRAQ